MGMVYRAFDVELQREVALKFLYEDTAGANSHEALLQEARIASALNHPNICTVYDVGDANGQAYIAMEYVAGRELSSLIRGGSLPTETVIQFGLQLADALAYAHDHGVIHRDLKASNIAVTKQYRVKILDFGLARHLDPVTPNGKTQTLPEQPVPVQGTLQYAAPEVLRHALPDARSDIWSLGVVLYEMATGKLPFMGETLVEIQSAILRDPPDLKEVRAPGLAAIIGRCLAKDPVQRYQRAGELHAALQTLASVGTMPVPKLEAEPDRKLRNRVVWPLLVVIIAVVLGIVTYRLWPHPTASTKFESIAVLPLSNLSGVAEQDYLVDGMTDILITDLAKIRAFKRVISRNSVIRYKNIGDTSLKQIAHDLNVDLLLTGTVTQQKESVRINLQLIDPAGDKLIWAQDYEGNLGNMLTMEGQIALAVAEQVKLTLTPQERQHLGTSASSNSAAAIAYLKGRYYWNKRDFVNLEKSRQYFQQAIDDDPSYALAYAGLADYYQTLANEGIHETAKAKEAALKALQLDPALAEPHAALAMVAFDNGYDTNSAEAELNRAIELNPNYATAHQFYAVILTFMGQIPRALEEAKRAQSLDPLSLTINSYLGYCLYLNRDYEAAQSQLNRTLEMDSDFAFAHYFYARLLVQEANPDAAIVHAKRAVALAPEIPGMTATLAYAYAASGHEDQAIELMKDLEVREHKPLPAEAAFHFAYVHNTSAAIKTLESAANGGSLWSISMPSEPALDSVRSDPRFAALWQRVSSGTLVSGSHPR